MSFPLIAFVSSQGLLLTAGLRSRPQSGAEFPSNGQKTELEASSITVVEDWKAPHLKR
jgi:hypothetical protein